MLTVFVYREKSANYHLIGKVLEYEKIVSKSENHAITNHALLLKEKKNISKVQENVTSLLKV